jgi:hypothetical protein
LDFQVVERELQSVCEFRESCAGKRGRDVCFCDEGEGSLGGFTVEGDEERPQDDFAFCASGAGAFDSEGAAGAQA